MHGTRPLGDLTRLRTGAVVLDTVVSAMVTLVIV
jgi:hypothetical protein